MNAAIALFRCSSCNSAFYGSQSLTTLKCGHSRCLSHSGECLKCHQPTYLTAAAGKPNKQLQDLIDIGPTNDSCAMDCWICCRAFNISTCIPTTLACGHTCCMQDIPQYRTQFKKCFCKEADVPTKFFRDELLCAIVNETPRHAENEEEFAEEEESEMHITRRRLEQSLLDALQGDAISIATAFMKIEITDTFTITFAEAGGIAVLFKLLTLPDEKPLEWSISLHEKVLNDLTAITNANHAYKDCIVLCGGISLLVKLLAPAAVSERTKWFTAGLLYSIAADSETSRTAVEAAGALDALLPMLLNGSLYDVRQVTARAVITIAVPAGFTYAEEDIAAKVLVAHHGMEGEVLKALTLLSCWALGDTNVPLLILKSFGVGNLITLLQTSSTWSIKLALCRLLQFVVPRNHDTVTLCSETLLPVLIDLLESEHLQVAVARVIAAIAEQESTGRAALLANSKSVPALVRALCSGDTPAVTMWAAHAMGFLCTASIQAQVYVVGAGGVHALVKMLNNGSPIEVPLAAWVLCAVTEKNQNAQEIAATEGAIPLLVRHLTEGNAQLRAQAARLVGMLAEAGNKNSNCAAIVREGGIAPLLALMVTPSFDFGYTCSSFALRQIFQDPDVRSDVSFQVLASLPSILSQLADPNPSTVAEAVRNLKCCSELLTAPYISELQESLAYYLPTLLPFVFTCPVEVFEAVVELLVLSATGTGAQDVLLAGLSKHIAVMQSALWSGSGNSVTRQRAVDILSSLSPYLAALGGILFCTGTLPLLVALLGIGDISRRTVKKTCHFLQDISEKSVLCRNDIVERVKEFLPHVAPKLFSTNDIVVAHILLLYTWIDGIVGPTTSEIIIDMDAFLDQVIALLSNDKVCKAAILVLAHFAQDRPNIQYMIIARGGLSELTALLCDVHFAAPAARAITTMIYLSDELPHCIARLLKCLNYADPALRAAASSAMRLAVRSGPTAVKIIIDCGAVPLLQALLLSDRVDVQRTAISLLAELVQEKEACRSELTIDVVATLKLMLGTQDDMLVRPAALLVCALARCEEILYRDEIIRGGVVSVLVSLLETSESFENLEYCAKAFFYLTISNAQGQIAAADSGAIEQLAKRIVNGPYSEWYINALFTTVLGVVKYQQMFCEVPGVVSRLLELLLNEDLRDSIIIILCRYVCHHDKCPLEDILHTLTVLLRQLLQGDEPANLVCGRVRAIGCLMESDNVRDSAVALECIAPVVALLRQTECRAQAADALALICQQNSANCAAAVRENAFELISSILWTCDENSKDIENAMRVLGCIVLYNTENPATALYLGMIPRLTEILSSATSSVNAKAAAKQCLDVLSLVNDEVAEAILRSGGGQQSSAAATPPADKVESEAGAQVVGAATAMTASVHRRRKRKKRKRKKEIKEEM